MSREWLVDSYQLQRNENARDNVAVARGEDSRTNSIISATALAKVFRPRSIHGGSDVKL